MNETTAIDRSGLNALIKEYGGIDSFTTEQAVNIVTEIFRIIRDHGKNPEDRAEFFEGACRIFNVECINKGDYSHGKYILAPNHISEFDGLIFGTLIPNTMVVAKTDWGENPHLNEFLGKLFQMTCVKRKDTASGMHVMKSCIDHLKNSENGAVTIFVQQTIADIDITTPEDIAIGVYHIAQKTSTPIIPVFCEQASPEALTRVVFGEPLVCDDKDHFGRAWLDAEIALRDSLTDPAARAPKLCEKHQKPISQRSF